MKPDRPGEVRLTGHPDGYLAEIEPAPCRAVVAVAASGKHRGSVRDSEPAVSMAAGRCQGSQDLIDGGEWQRFDRAEHDPHLGRPVQHVGGHAVHRHDGGCPAHATTLGAPRTSLPWRNTFRTFPGYAPKSYGSPST